MCVWDWRFLTHLNSLLPSALSSSADLCVLCFAVCKTIADQEDFFQLLHSLFSVVWQEVTFAAFAIKTCVCVLLWSLKIKLLLKCKPPPSWQRYCDCKRSNSDNVHIKMSWYLMCSITPTFIYPLSSSSLSSAPTSPPSSQVGPWCSAALWRCPARVEWAALAGWARRLGTWCAPPASRGPCTAWRRVLSAEAWTPRRLLATRSGAPVWVPRWWPLWGCRSGAKAHSSSTSKVSLEF